MTQNESRFKLIAAVYVMLIYDNQVLLLRRFNTGYEDGSYSLIAGHLDGSEQIVEAAIREAHEEAGVGIASEDVHIARVVHRRIEDERVEFFVEVRNWTGTITNTEPHKCDKLDWFRMDQLPQNVIPHVRYAIENFRDGNWFQTFGWN